MSISGRLDDVSVSEVMQFIHLGERTGTLYLEGDKRKLEVGFNRGRVITASGEGTRLGDLLLDRGLVEQCDIENALEVQSRDGSGQVLGEILVSIGRLQRNQLEAAVRDYIRDTILDAINWRRGVFRFALNEVRSIEARAPDEVLPAVSLDTQMLLLEATRLLDERNRSGSMPEPSSDEGAEDENISALNDVAERALDGSRAALAQVFSSVQIISSRRDIIEELAAELSKSGTRVDRRHVGTAGFALPGETSPIVIADLEGGVSLESLSRLHHQRPEAAIIAVAGSETLRELAFQAGAIAVSRDSIEELCKKLGQIAEERRSVLKSTRSRKLLEPNELDKLRRFSEEIRAGILSTSAALALLRILSESLERAVLFLAQDHLISLGGYGISTAPRGGSVANLTRGLRLDLSEQSIFSEALAEGRAREVRFDVDRVPQNLFLRIGLPANGRGAIFPVLGSEQVLLAVYGDNGPLDRPIDQVGLLDLVALQIGVAVENESLRKQLAAR